jgi:hypothetical protein
MHAAVEGLLEAMLSTPSMPKYYKQDELNRSSLLTHISTQSWDDADVIWPDY